MEAGLDAEIYKNVPAEQQAWLIAFRQQHPYKELLVGDVCWRYIAGGQGPETLLILGGAMSVGDTAFEKITHFEDRFRVISPSYPAEGKMTRVAEGLAAILDAEGVARVHVLGHSLGAAVGHALARLCPERVDKIILDGFGLYTPKHLRSARLFFKLPFGFLVAYYRRTIKRLMGKGTDPETAFWNAYMLELLTRLHTKESLVAQFHLLFDIFDHAGAYGIFRPVDLPGRVLLLLAKDDRGFTEDERQALIASYPNAKVHWFGSGGHLAGFTQRDEFNAVRDQFLLGA